MITEVRENKCTGCSNCFALCPLDVFRLNTDREAAPPCQGACPAGVNMRGYMYLLKTGMYDEAVKVIRETLPLPGVTGRVCFHPCEAECSRTKVDEAVNINAMERFVAEYGATEKVKPVTITHAKKVAVIGSGPAGISAAYFLIKKGYPVTVFEAMPKLGGMLRYGIPEYRLPKKVLDGQIKYIEDLGVEFQTGMELGKNLTLNELMEKGYSAVFIAVGAWKNQKMGIPGEDLAGVVHGLDYLKSFNTGKKAKTGKKVVVVGGGNVAIDAARTALRAGAEVNLVYRRTKQEMPANAEEIEAAEVEGVNIRYLAAPVKILGKNGKVTGVECVEMKLGEPDASGRKRPVPVQGSEFVIEADMVIPAVGETVEIDWAEKEKLTVSGGTLKADKNNLGTGIAGVFAGGDAVNGPTSVVQAIASGRKASDVIELYLKGKDIKSYQDKKVKLVERLPGEGMPKKERQHSPVLRVPGRVKTFAEVRLGFDEDTAVDEVQRCMTCGSLAYIAYPEDCMTCYTCELKCPYDALYVHPFKEVLPYALK